MSEHQRAFVVVAVLSVLSFVVLHRPAVAMGMDEPDFRRRRNLWLAVTALAFLSSNFWVFVLVSGGLSCSPARSATRSRSTCSPVSRYRLSTLRYRGWASSTSCSS
jgi:hypothetical protein